MQTKVSMVIAVYNKGKYLSAMLDSVLAQTWGNIEVVIINDGSTDNCGDIIAEYLPKLARRGFETRSFSQENKGVCYSLGYGLSVATGECCCMPDADDEIYPQYVDRLANYLEADPECALVQCDNDRFGIVEELTLSSNYGASLVPHSLDAYLLYRYHMAIHSIMVRKDHLLSGGVCKVMMECDCISQEIPFLGGCASGNKKKVYINETLYKYNKIVGTLSNPDNLEYVTKIRYEGSERALRLYSLFDERNEAVMWIGSLAKMSKSVLQTDKYAMFENDLKNRLKNYLMRYRMFSISDNDIEKMNKLDFGVNYRFVSNKILNISPGVIDIQRGKRIIAYSAYGKGLYGLKKALVGSDLCPDVFWDRAARNNDFIDGIAVEIPRFETLTENDTVLILLKLKSHIAEVLNEIKNTQAKVYYYLDVMDYLVDYYFNNEKENKNQREISDWPSDRGSAHTTLKGGVSNRS
jgi:glycosyltransferase involved in cell wall biosynthesis